MYNVHLQNNILQNVNLQSNFLYIIHIYILCIRIPTFAQKSNFSTGQWIIDFLDKMIEDNNH